MLRRALVSLAVVTLASGVLTASPVAASGGDDNYLVIYGSASQVRPDQVRGRGAEVNADLSQAGLLAVRTSRPDALKTLPGVVGVAREQVRFDAPQEQVTRVEEAPTASEGCAGTVSSCPLQWDLARIHVPQAWTKTMGSSRVKVAMLDTGVTSSHDEVGPNYDKAESKSFVKPNPVCPFDASTYGSLEDFVGHGTWTATHVAGVDGPLMTGIAPKATLVNVRVLGVCGFGYDSWAMAGMLYGNQIGAQVENMSLGGYLCGHGVVEGSIRCGSKAAVGDDPLIWRAYRQVVSYLLRHGTLVVASAGNDHVRLDAGGQVVSHGSISGQGDLFGLTKVPGGVAGVVAVAAVNRFTAEGSAAQTRFGQYGAGRSDQLAYYSSYGERIAVSAPGGSRNFNIPLFDCVPPSPLSACGRLFPFAGPDNPGDFGAVGGFTSTGPCSHCYGFVQGTSMATAQVTGVAVLALSANPKLPVRDLARLLRRSVTSFTDSNATPPTEDDPSSPTWNSIDYDEEGVSNDLMGTGVIDAARAVGIHERSGGDQEEERAA